MQRRTAIASLVPVAKAQRRYADGDAKRLAQPSLFANRVRFKRVMAKVAEPWCIADLRSFAESSQGYGPRVGFGLHADSVKRGAL